MKSRNLVIILCFSSLLTLIITVALYTYQFGSINLSDKEQDWVSFSDYFSGILEPILALLNLMILTYLTIKLVEIEDNRNTWTLQELVRPYADIAFINSEESIEIKLENCGMGPLIMNNILITDGNKVNAKNFSEFIKNCKSNANFEYQLYNLTEEHGAIGKEKNITLLKVIGDAKNADFIRFLKNLEEKLTNLEIQISYSDMYKRKIDTLKTKINFHKPI